MNIEASDTTNTGSTVRASGLLDSAVWNGLTTEQQAGLALLLAGRHVTGWRIQAALELLFAGGPAVSTEREGQG